MPTPSSRAGALASIGSFSPKGDKVAAGRMRGPPAPPPTASLPESIVPGVRGSVRAAPLGVGCSNTEPLGRSFVCIVFSRFRPRKRDLETGGVRGGQEGR